MNPEILSKFKTLFEQQKKNLLYTSTIASEDFQLKPEDMSDETDLATSELETSMRMRLRNREALFLKKIDEALARIEAGTFGTCESCEEDIEIRRLEARPTTTLCVLCKEAQERNESLHIDGHRAKSLGKVLRIVRTG